jgi:acetylornithine/succinyldiaminopimelate/putrescine aminotransferase
VRFLPPLIVTEAEIDEACAKLDAACVALKSGALAHA